MNVFDEHETLKQLGEFGLIERIAGLFEPASDKEFTGIGDDCAVLRNDSGRSTLITTDMLLQGRHFRREWSSANDLGYKSLAVNLSDISAMGGTPRYALLSIGLPLDIAPAWIDGFLNETRRLCETHGVKLIGGDTSKSGSLIISYTVLGFIEDKKILWRSSAKAGDKIGLIGKVGESGAGLRLLEGSHNKEIPTHRYLIEAHNRPRLYVDEARFLADSGFVHAMIDLSDGIQSDAGHIAKRSGVTLIIDTNLLPINDTLTDVCDTFSWSAEEIALTSGEDYALMFTFDREKENTLKNQLRESFPDTCFTVIGKVKEGDGNADVRFLKNGETFELQQHGFDQFKTD